MNGKQLKANYNVCVKRKLALHISVNPDVLGVSFPKQVSHGARIVFNLSPSAAHNFSWGYDRVIFYAMFGSVSHTVIVPYDAIYRSFVRSSTGHDYATPITTTTYKGNHLRLVK